MSEHLTEKSIGQECSASCTKCGRATLHRVDRVAVGSHAGKPGPCLEHDSRHMTREQEARDAKNNRHWRQRKLFEGAT